MEISAKIYVAGHRGMVGSALLRRLQAGGYTNIITRTSDELDLRNQAAVADFFAAERPEYVFLTAARVGGINANNTYPAEFLYDNLLIESNVIHQSYLHGVQKLLFLGSSCIYPKLAPQPIREEYLLTGLLEPTNEPYAVAKIAGIKLCQAYRKQYGCSFIAAMPTNLYGPNDNYHLQNSHVLPALLRKFHTAVEQEASIVEVWGTGTPRREFLHVDDLADACLHLMLHYNGSDAINIGTGEDISIGDLARLIQRITGFRGKVRFNALMPDGTPRKLLDVSRLNALGWRASIPLQEGIKSVYALTEWAEQLVNA
ncbi:GDP-L-fucose synthase family protein [Hymenobacter sp. BT491]|uniref:GDP-L-fucose synthase family protein n=1 Tax=Hymenobacter sp. BT491 TaxID=2766779 RepID=UPI0016537A83|nr:GDP-L-fucose synthase [Hymenobacter sp. BT491]MBC6988799.1 GDP-L-fucose synthase [Hymenobacter sp. BT491]